MAMLSHPLSLGWRSKALAYRALDAMPGGRRLYALSQRYVTRSVPRKLAPTRDVAAIVLQHRDAFAGFAPEAPYFEFGAGWDLYGNIVQWCYGRERQHVYDLRRWARAELINTVIRHLHDDPPPDAVRLPTELVDERRLEADLRQRYGIDYRAPADAAASGLPGGSMSCIATTSVLEHVPPAELRALLAECCRLMAPGARMSHVIDYADHYALADASISPYNFLRFDDDEWQRFNPGLHYQNRWRHADFLALFDALGLRVVSQSLFVPDDAGSQLARQPLADCFARMPVAELAPLASHVVLERGLS
jgi:hypothetical protein